MTRSKKAPTQTPPVAIGTAEEIAAKAIDRGSTTWLAVMAYAAALKQSAVEALLRVPRYAQGGLADREGADDFYRGLAAAADRLMALNKVPEPPSELEE